MVRIVLYNVYDICDILIKNLVEKNIEIVILKSNL